MTVHSQPLLPKLVWIIPLATSIAEKKRGNGKLAACSVTVSPPLRHCAKQHSTAAQGTPAAGCTGATPAPYQPCCSPPCLAITADTHSPATISTHRFKSAKYQRKMFIIYFSADADTMKTGFRHEIKKPKR